MDKGCIHPTFIRSHLGEISLEDTLEYRLLYAFYWSVNWDLEKATFLTPFHTNEKAESIVHYEASKNKWSTFNSKEVEHCT